MGPRFWLSGAAYELGEDRLTYDRITGLQQVMESRSIPFLPQVFGLGACYKSADVYRLASCSVAKTLAAASVEGSAVDCVIASAASFRHEFDTQKLGFGKALAANQVNPKAFYAMCGTGCVAFLSALDLAKSLIVAQGFEFVLIVNIDHIVSSDDRDRFINYALVSDSGSSALISRRTDLGISHEILALSKRTDVAQMQNGIRWNSSDNGLTVIAEVLANGHTDRSLIDQFLSTNTFLPIKKNREQSLGFTSRQLYLSNVPRMGHCLGADALVNLADCVAENGPGARLRLLYSEADGHAAAALLRG